MSRKVDENTLLLTEAQKIVIALGKMFAPCCEVLLHDLQHPENSVLHIENPLSGRKVGDPGTEITRARSHDQHFPDVLQNYANSFPDGRPAKSTSIGIRNSQGKYVAAICLNLDLSWLTTAHRILGHILSTSENVATIRETLRTRSLGEVREAIEQYAASHNTDPKSLSPKQRRELVHLLSERGLLGLRGATPLAAKVLGITRASIYNDLKSHHRSPSAVPAHALAPAANPSPTAKPRRSAKRRVSAPALVRTATAADASGRVRRAKR